ncbi:MAG: class I SAM-dependent methyltransferase [Traorella sp.]
MSHYFTDNRELAKNRKELSFRFSCFNLTFVSDNGVFCKNYIDEGSIVLLEVLYKQQLKDKILDVGCGYGTIGITLKKCFPSSHVDMIEINPRAIELAQFNAQKNQCDVHIFESDIYSNVSDCDYTDIVTNPPIRTGKKVIYKIFKEAYDHLVDKGFLWVVIRKNHGAISAKKYIESIFGNCEIIKKDKGYYVLKSQKNIDKLTDMI